VQDLRIPIDVDLWGRAGYARKQFGVGVVSQPDQVVIFMM
jgi:hypothetical protein